MNKQVLRCACQCVLVLFMSMWINVYQPVTVLAGDNALTENPIKFDEDEKKRPELAADVKSPQESNAGEKPNSTDTQNDDGGSVLSSEDKGEDTPLNLGSFKDTDASSVGADGLRNEKEETSIWSLLAQLFGMLALLMGVLIGSMYLMKKYLPGMKEFDGNGVIQVLTKARLTPTQTLYMVRIGKRIMVLGVSASDIRPISEITDPAEMELLIAETSSKGNDSISRSFKDIFQKNVTEFDEDIGSIMQEEEDVDKLKDELAKIRSRIHMWSQDDEDGQGES